MKNYLPVLKRIRKLGEKAKQQYVRTCDKEFLDCASECAKNIIKGNVPLTNSQKATLRRSQEKRLESVVREEDVVAKEASHFAEGWLSDCLTATDTVGAR